MPKTVSVSQAQEEFDSLLAWAVEYHDVVIIEHDGEPHAVMMPFEDYEELRASKERNDET